MKLKDPIIEEHEGFKIVRDDLIEGGTKRRFFNEYIQYHNDVDEFVYASSRQGYAQLALTLSCKDMGKKATVFIPKANTYTSVTWDAVKNGCNMVHVPMGFLNVLQSKAADYCNNNNSRKLVKFGGDNEIILNSIKKIASSIDIEEPKEVWTAIGSGTLTRGLQRAWPNAEFYGVQVGHEITNEEAGRAKVFKSKYKFEQKCKKGERPPFPSSAYYDAKVWKVMKHYAHPGALMWNVAK